VKKTIRTTMVMGALATVVGVAGCDDPSVCGGPGVMCTVMGTGTPGLGKDGVAPDKVQLYLPQDMTQGPDGKLYVLDWNNHRVRTVIDGKVVTVLGTGSLGDALEGPALAASLNHPTHLTFSPTGKMIMSAWHNSKVMEVDLAAGTLRNLCGTGVRSYSGDGGAALMAVLDLPVATVFDSSGRMLIMDQGNQRVRRVDAAGLIDTVVGPPKTYVHVPPGFTRACFDDGMGGQACKVCRTEFAMDPNCEGTTFKPQGFGGDGGPATAAFMFQPFSQSAPPAGRMDMGPGDRLFFTDTGNQRVRVVEADGTIRTVAGSGPETFDINYIGGYSGDGGPAIAAKLQRPTDVAVSADGSFYIADTDNHCVRKVDAAGIITTFAGRCGVRGFDGDSGLANQALLDRPYGVEIGSMGEVYIADTHNHRIRVVWP